LDLDGSGSFDVTEFKKLVRKLADREIHKAKDVFHQCLGTHDCITAEEGRQLFKSVGFPRPIFFTWTWENGYDEESFLCATKFSAKRLHRIIQRNHGFSLPEAEEMARRFFLLTTTGQIDFFCLGKLLQSMYSRQWENRMTRPRLVALLREAAASSASTTIGFLEFLYVARQCQEIVEMDRLRREQAAIVETEYTPLQVSEFRHEFLGQTERTELRFDDVRALLQRVMSLNAKRTAELHHEYLKVLTCDGAPNIETMEFPEFLIFMRRLIDLDLIDWTVGT